MNKFAVTYTVDYSHRVIVGMSAPNVEAAINEARTAFDMGTIWDNTEAMPLLFDDYEEADHDSLHFSAESIQDFPVADASVEALKRRELAFAACAALLKGETQTALGLAKQAMPWVANN